MPRPRFEKLAPAKREAILVAAAVEFAAQGYEAASLNRVIERAGISKGALYYYFDDKADLFATVTDFSWKAILPDVPPDPDHLDAETFWPTLRSAYGDMLRRIQEYPWLAGVGKLLYHPPDDVGIGAVVREQFERVDRWMASLVGRGQALGRVREDLPEGLLIAMVTGAATGADRWMVDHWDDLAPAAAGGLATSVFDVIRRLAEPPKEQGS